jgi:hypothetical protein
LLTQPIKVNFSKISFDKDPTVQNIDSISEVPTSKNESTSLQKSEYLLTKPEDILNVLPQCSTQCSNTHYDPKPADKPEVIKPAVEESKMSEVLEQVNLISDRFSEALNQTQESPSSKKQFAKTLVKESKQQQVEINEILTKITQTVEVIEKTPFLQTAPEASKKHSLGRLMYDLKTLADGKRDQFQREIARITKPNLNGQTPLEYAVITLAVQNNWDPVLTFRWLGYGENLSDEIIKHEFEKITTGQANENDQIETKEIEHPEPISADPLPVPEAKEQRKDEPRSEEITEFYDDIPMASNENSNPPSKPVAKPSDDFEKLNAEVLPKQEKPLKIDLNESREQPKPKKITPETAGDYRSLIEKYFKKRSAVLNNPDLFFTFLCEVEPKIRTLADAREYYELNCLAA